jgi:hypothetical protein
VPPNGGGQWKSQQEANHNNKQKILFDILKEAVYILSQHRELIARSGDDTNLPSGDGKVVNGDIRVNARRMWGEVPQKEYLQRQLNRPPMR